MSGVEPATQLAAVDAYDMSQSQGSGLYLDRIFVFQNRQATCGRREYVSKSRGPSLIRRHFISE